MITPKAHKRLFQKGDLLNMQTKPSIIEAVNIVSMIPCDTVKSLFVVHAYTVKTAKIP